jgi:hypothetical protein
VFTANAEKIADFVNAGGGLFTNMGQYGWLTALLPTATYNSGGCNGGPDATADGAADFGLTNDIVTACWHGYFTGNVGTLKTLVDYPYPSGSTRKVGLDWWRRGDAAQFLHAVGKSEQPDDWRCDDADGYGGLPEWNGLRWSDGHFDSSFRTGCRTGPHGNHEFVGNSDIYNNQSIDYRYEYLHRDGDDQFISQICLPRP